MSTIDFFFLDSAMMIFWALDANCLGSVISADTCSTFLLRMVEVNVTQKLLMAFLKKDRFYNDILINFKVSFF